MRTVGPRGAAGENEADQAFSSSDFSVYLRKSYGGWKRNLAS